jgi:hypothetical protein
MVPRRTRILAYRWACFTAVAGLSLAHGAQLQFTVLDSEAGQPVPCRIHLSNAAGKPVQPKGLPFWHDHFVCPGVANLELTPGQYAYEIDRGPEYLVVTGRVAVPESGTQHLTNHLNRLVTLAKEGWWPSI